MFRTAVLLFIFICLPLIAFGINPGDRALDEYRCPICGWTPRADGPMNSSDTLEPLVAVMRYNGHMEDHWDKGDPRSRADLGHKTPAADNYWTNDYRDLENGAQHVRQFGFPARTQLVQAQVEQAEGRPRVALRKAGLRSLLRIKHLRAQGEAKTAIAHVLSDPELFDAVFDGLSSEYNDTHKAGGAVDDFLKWLGENWMEVLKMILMIVPLFIDDGNHGALLDPAEVESPFRLIAFAPGKVRVKEHYRNPPTKKAEPKCEGDSCKDRKPAHVEPDDKSPCGNSKCNCAKCPGRGCRCDKCRCAIRAAVGPARRVGRRLRCAGEAVTGRVAGVAHVVGCVVVRRPHLLPLRGLRCRWF